MIRMQTVASYLHSPKTINNMHVSSARHQLIMTSRIDEVVEVYQLGLVLIPKQKEALHLHVVSKTYSKLKHLHIQTISNWNALKLSQ
jgi:hypothetical protein